MSVPGWKTELHQRRALDRLRFDVLDAVDVEEVVLVVVGEEPFHLRGVHAAVRLGHVDDGHAQIGKDVARIRMMANKPFKIDGNHHD